MSGLMGRSGFNIEKAMELVEKNHKKQAEAVEKTMFVKEKR